MDFAWVTLATNDSYSLGALVLGHSLRKAGTAHKLAVLITPAVSSPMRNQLATLFDVVEVVDVLDSKDEANLALLKRPELGITFTKINCWRLTQFTKCVFLDADTLVVRNSDELFDRDEFSAAPDVGWPDCFNSGVFVFKPSLETHKQLIQFALEKGSFDGGDQGLLNQFFSTWATDDIKKHLPFVYNLTSVAVYSYIPAFKQFGAETRIVHFIGPLKPWLEKVDPVTRTVTPSSDSAHLQPLLQHWWDLFCEKVHPGLSANLECSGMLTTSAPTVSSPDPPFDSTCTLSEPDPVIAPSFPQPYTPYIERDDERQFNLPYQPFQVVSSEGDLLNITFGDVAKAIDTQESSANKDCQEENRNDDHRFNERNEQIDDEPPIVQPRESEEPIGELNPDVPHFESSDKPELEVEANPFDYHAFTPDEACISAYLEQNVVDYQPFTEPHYQDLSHSLSSSLDPPPLPRFLTIPEDDPRQSGKEMIPEPWQPPLSQHEQPHMHSEESYAPQVHHDPSSECQQGPNLASSQPSTSENSCDPTPSIARSRSMSNLMFDAQDTSTFPVINSQWKSQPIVGEEETKKKQFILPGLKPLLPKPMPPSFFNPIPKYTEVTEVHMVTECSDPFGPPADQVGFVERELIKQMKEARISYDPQIVHGPPTKYSSKQLECQAFQALPIFEENECMELSECKRQAGNKPLNRTADNLEVPNVPTAKSSLRRPKKIRKRVVEKWKPPEKDNKNYDVEDILKKLSVMNRGLPSGFPPSPSSASKSGNLHEEMSAARNLAIYEPYDDWKEVRDKVISSNWSHSDDTKRNEIIDETSNSLFSPKSHLLYDSTYSTEYFRTKSASFSISSDTNDSVRLDTPLPATLKRAKSLRAKRSPKLHLNEIGQMPKNLKPNITVIAATPTNEESDSYERGLSRNTLITRDSVMGETLTPYDPQQASTNLPTSARNYIKPSGSIGPEKLEINALAADQSEELGLAGDDLTERVSQAFSRTMTSKTELIPINHCEIKSERLPQLGGKDLISEADAIVLPNPVAVPVEPICQPKDVNMEQDALTTNPSDSEGNQLEFFDCSENERIVDSLKKDEPDSNPIEEPNTCNTCVGGNMEIITNIERNTALFDTQLPSNLISVGLPIKKSNLSCIVDSHPISETSDEENRCAFIDRVTIADQMESADIAPANIHSSLLSSEATCQIQDVSVNTFQNNLKEMEERYCGIGNDYSEDVEENSNGKPAKLETHKSNKCLNEEYRVSDIRKEPNGAVLSQSSESTLEKPIMPIDVRDDISTSTALTLTIGCETPENNNNNNNEHNISLTHARIPHSVEFSINSTPKCMAAQAADDCFVEKCNAEGTMGSSPLSDISSTALSSIIGTNKLSPDKLEETELACSAIGYWDGNLTLASTSYCSNVSPPSEYCPVDNDRTLTNPDENYLESASSPANMICDSAVASEPDAVLVTKNVPVNKGALSPKLSDYVIDYEPLAANVEPKGENLAPSYAIVAKISCDATAALAAKTSIVRSSEFAVPCAVKSRAQNAASPKNMSPTKLRVFEPKETKTQPVMPLNTTKTPKRKRNEPMSSDVKVPANRFELLPEVGSDIETTPKKKVTTSLKKASSSRPFSHPTHPNPDSVIAPLVSEEPELFIPEPDDHSGIAGAIAQLNLQEALDDPSSLSPASSAAQAEYLRRQSWETGNIDYLGRDSFANIWSKISETLSESPASPTSPNQPN